MSPLTFALQALLARHESYMASAEQDRAELNARLEQVETENAALEAKNSLTIEENRALLDQLEHLNTTVSDSEAKIRGLETSLHASQETVQQLESAVERADEMERHIAVLESEQAALQSSLTQSEEEMRSAAYRWKQAQRGVVDLQAQVERMEKQAEEDRERHAEAMERLEKQRAREKELHTAAGRLKGAAAARSMADGKGGGGSSSSGVVSHFVRDLLQDNANLQIGVAELRELLSNSHDEIQALREQLYFHQPVGNESGTPSNLKSELEPPPPVPSQASGTSQELHVHHHYHVGGPSTPKKPKKKKPPFNPARFSTPDLPAPPNPPFGWRPNRSCTTPGMLSHHPPRGSVSALSASSTRWSVSSDSQSDLMSIASSPHSNLTNSIFDRRISESSVPTSPTTTADPSSPSPKASRQKNSASVFLGAGSPTPRSLFPQERYQASSLNALPQLPLASEALEDRIRLSGLEPSDSGPTHDKRPSSGDSPSPAPDDRSDFTVRLAATPGREEFANPNKKRLLDKSSPAQNAYEPRCGGGNDSRVSGKSTPTKAAAGPDSEPETDNDYFDPYKATVPRGLRRVVSHESIMSLSNGLDVHTLKTRPSQLALRPMAASTTGTTGISTITATPTLSRARDEGKRGSVILRDNLDLAGLGLSVPRNREGARATSGSTPSPANRGAGPASRISSTGTKALGKLVFWKKTRSNKDDQNNATPSQTPPATESSDLPAATMQITDLADRPAPTDLTSSTPATTVTPSAPIPTPPPTLTVTPSYTTGLSPPQNSHPSADLAKSSTTSIATTATAATASTSHSKKSTYDWGSSTRAPGVNQPGSVPIPGFLEYWAAHQRYGPSSKVSPGVIDREALRDGLDGS